MTLRYRSPATPFLKGAYVALGLAGVLVAVMGYRAATLSPLPEADVLPENPGVLAPEPRETVLVWEAVRMVERDPFHPARRPPDERYLLPEEEGVLEDPRIGDVAFVGRVRLIGTAVEIGGGFAMAQLGAAPPRVVRPGEELGGLTLRSVSRGAAEFVRGDGSPVTLKVAGSS